MTAAHGGWNSEVVPLGGGAAVCERLSQLWQGKSDVQLQVIGSGPDSPPGLEYRSFSTPRTKNSGDWTHPATLSELEYAAFCRDFEAQVTDHLLGHARGHVVIAHDISEAPHFGRLARAGIRCIPIFHVDVVDYFNRFYLGDLLPPSWWTSLHRSTSQWLPWPDVLQLVFDKQRLAMEHCPYVVVPSNGMKSKLLTCYPGVLPERVQVVPWGAPLERFQGPALEEAVEQISAEFELGSLYHGRSNGPLLVTLSRISPEKNQAGLLESIKLAELEGRTPLGLTLVIAGAPAYMRGQSYLKKLQSLAGELRKTRVIFAGHLAGLRKAALLKRADLMVVASRHESYGLTTLEAFNYGLPVVGLKSDGVAETVCANTGRVVPVNGDYRLALWDAIEELLAQPEERQRLSQNAQAVADTQSFSLAADRLLELCSRVAPTPKAIGVA